MRLVRLSLSYFKLTNIYCIRLMVVREGYLQLEVSFYYLSMLLCKTTKDFFYKGREREPI